MGTVDTSGVSNGIRLPFVCLRVLRRSGLPPSLHPPLSYAMADSSLKAQNSPAMSPPLRCLLLGAQGQVGQALLPRLPSLGTLHAATRRQADLTQPARLQALLHELRPDVIVNAAAYTTVDQAEHDEATAMQVNAHAVRQLAEFAAQTGALLLHYSTDYVFDGRKPTPYDEHDAPHPLSVYGASKLAGEAAIATSGCRALVLRTSWVFSAHGGNFIKTMLRLACERDGLRVVADQFGAPTGVELIARVTEQALRACQQGRMPCGLYHLSAAGSTSWHGLAQQVLRVAAKHGAPLRVQADAVEAIPTSAYPLPAPRPLNSRLDTSKLCRALDLKLPDWHEEVNDTVARLCAAMRPTAQQL